MPHASDPTTAIPPEEAVSLPEASRAAPTALDNEENRHDPRLVRWNLATLVFDVSCFSIGMAFLDLSAVLPLMMERLGASGLLIGAFAALRSLTYNGFQVLVAYATHGRPRQKPFINWSLCTTRIPLLLMPFFLWHAADSESARLAALLAVVVLMTGWALGDGLVCVPWTEIIARSFSTRTRGRFFTTTQLISGVVSIAIAGVIVQNVLNSPHLPYPANYALLTGVFAVFMQFSLLGVLLIREPPAPAYTRTLQHPPLGDYFRRVPALIRSNPTFQRLAIIQLLVGFGGASAPFYVLYATRRFSLGDQWGGLYQVWMAVGLVLLMPLWTFLSERRGPAAAVKGVALGCLLSPLLALTLGNLSPVLFGLVFLFMGGSLGWGLWIALNHFLLSHIAEEERPIFVALINLLFTPAALYPFFGGLLVQQKQLVSVAGVPVLFLLTALVVAVGFALALRLDAPSTET
jgi:MFS family permease